MLRRALNARPGLRVAILGVGNELRGDDGAGVIVARRLLRRFGALRTLGGGHLESGHVLILNGGCAPENVTGVLRHFGPHVLLVIDAAEMNHAPGTVRLFRLGVNRVAGAGGKLPALSTHSLPMSALARYCQSQFGGEWWALCVQPAQNGLDEPLSPVVRRAVNRMVTSLHGMLLALGASPLKAAATPRPIEKEVS
jgi:hydrogenase 3 maturation protease